MMGTNAGNGPHSPGITVSRFVIWSSASLGGCAANDQEWFAEFLRSTGYKTLLDIHGLAPPSLAGCANALEQVLVRNNLGVLPRGLRGERPGVVRRILAFNWLQDPPRYPRTGAAIAGWMCQRPGAGSRPKQPRGPPSGVARRTTRSGSPNSCVQLATRPSSISTDWRRHRWLDVPTPWSRFSSETT